VQHVEVTRRFDAAPGEVFDIYTDHARWSEWSGMLASRLEHPGRPHPNGPGALRVLGPRGFEAREEILHWDPPRRMTYRLVRGGLPLRDHEGEVRFEPDAGGTRVVWRCRFEPRIPGTGPLLRALVARFFRRALDGLARVHFPDRAPDRARA